MAKTLLFLLCITMNSITEQTLVQHHVKERDHPFKTSAFCRGGGVKNLPNLQTDSSKKLPTEGGRSQKS